MNGMSTGTKPAAKKILVTCFSHSGNTRVIANQIHGLVGGEIFEIVSVNPNPTDYDTVVEQARKELKASHRPKLKSKLENVKPYDAIFVGYPNWWGTFPMPVATFLEETDFTGKTVVPFCTHEGSRLGKSVANPVGDARLDQAPFAVQAAGRVVLHHPGEPEEGVHLLKDILGLEQPVAPVSPAGSVLTILTAPPPPRTANRHD